MRSPAISLSFKFLLIASFCLPCTQAFGQTGSVGQLVKQLPPGANSLMIVDVAKIRNSDIAKKENWFDSHAAETESGMLFLPDGTSLVCLASQLEYQLLMHNWTSGFLVFEKAPSLQSISASINGKMDVVARRDVVSSSSDMFVFQFNDQTIGTYAPANRQNLATWLSRISDSDTNLVSESLMKGVAAAEFGSPFVAVFDMKNVVGAGAILERAKDSVELKDKGIDPRKFCDCVGSIQSVLFTADISQSINAKIDIDFAENAELLAPVAKQLIQEVTDNHGIHIEGFENWDASVTGNRLTVSGELSKTGLRRVISIFDAPEPHMTASAGDSAANPNNVGAATKRYFDAISSMITELENDIGLGGDSTWKYQKWMKLYATKIGNLDMRDVDSQMLDFGGFVAKSLDDISLRVTSTHENQNVRNSNLMAYGSGSPAARYRRYGYGYYGYGYGAYGYRYGYDGAVANAQTEAEKRSIHQQGRASAIQFGADLFTNIKSRELDLRRAMVEKYPDNFK